MGNHHNKIKNIARTLLFIPAVIIAVQHPVQAQFFPQNPALDELTRMGSDNAWENWRNRHKYPPELTEEQQADCEKIMDEMLHKKYSPEEIAKRDAKDRWGYQRGRDENTARRLEDGIEQHKCILRVDINNNPIEQLR